MNYTNLRSRVRSFLGRHPSLFLPLIRMKPPKGWTVIGDATELVIEGFPRSGNTFAYAAFIMVQPARPVLAHHLHVPAQIIRAARRGIPALVLIRRPLDAVTSLVIREPELSPREMLRDFVGFYERLRSYRGGFVVGPFEEVVSDFGRTTRRINQRFGTRFVEFDHTPQNLERCFERIERMDRLDTGSDRVTETTVSRPSTEREQAKIEIRRRLLDDPRLRPLIDRATAIHRDYLEPDRPDLVVTDH